MSDAPRPLQGLPAHLRIFAVVCLLLSALVGLVATEEMVLLMRLPTEAPPSMAGMSPALQERMWRAQRQGLESMQASRVIVMCGLMVFSGLTLVGTARLLWPAGLSRDGIRRLLGTTAIITGALRVVDGAQTAAIARRMGIVLNEGLAVTSLPGADPLSIELVRKVGPAVLMGTAIVQTAVVAGIFVLFGQYLKSERVAQLFAAEAEDGTPRGGSGPRTDD